MARDDRKSTDLARLRGKLQRAISRYCSTVLTLLDEDEPDTLPRVLTALRPLEVHRAQLAGVRRASPEELERRLDALDREGPIGVPWEQLRDEVGGPT